MKEVSFYALTMITLLILSFQLGNTGEGEDLFELADDLSFAAKTESTTVSTEAPTTISTSETLSTDSTSATTASTASTETTPDTTISASTETTAETTLASTTAESTTATSATTESPTPATSPSTTVATSPATTLATTLMTKRAPVTPNVPSSREEIKLSPQSLNCKRKKVLDERVEDGKPEKQDIILLITVGIFILVTLLALGCVAEILVYCHRSKRKPDEKPLVANKPAPVLPGSAPSSSKDSSLKFGDLESEDKYSLEDQYSPADQEKMKAQLQETQMLMAKLRAHVKKTTAQHKSDTMSSKFVKRGPIYIPMEPDLPPPANLPNNIVLDKVTYDPSGNEMFDIGSDIDDIEMEPSTYNTVGTSAEEPTKREKAAPERSQATTQPSTERTK